MNSGHQIDVCLADDHTLYRRSLVNMIRTFPRIRQVYDASDGEELLKLVKKERPHVVLLDLQMPVLDGFQAAEYLLTNCDTVKVLVLSMYDDMEKVVRALELGVHGFLLKNIEPNELETAVHSVVDKDFYYNALVIEGLRLVARKGRNATAKQAPLTVRELEILELICQETSAKEIACKLGISEKTVHAHRLNIFDKLNLKSTVGLVKYAIQHQLFKLDILFETSKKTFD